MDQSFKFLYVYLTDACNLNCIHCWQSAPLEGKGKYSRLTFEECKNFLDDTVEMGLEKVTFSGGEPLLNPDFDKFARYFHKHSVQMAMETNGMLIPAGGILDTIKKYGVYCAVSLDGVKEETHNKHRRHKNAFKQTLLGIKKLEEAKMWYQLITAISNFNYHEIIPLADWIKKECKYCNSLKLNVVNSLGRAKDMDEDGLLFKMEDLPQITEEIAALVHRYPFKILLHVDPIFFSFKNLTEMKYACGGNCGYNSGLSILANGNVSICSLGKQMDKYIFGHVSTIDVNHVWNNNSLLTDIHQDTHKKLKGICANCIFKRHCLGGCRAEALCASGDFFAPHPRCQAYFESGKIPASKLISPPH
jgi:SynChlorMet cassette radical SAM/SPASM protein ScmF